MIKVSPNAEGEYTIGNDAVFQYREMISEIFEKICKL